MNTGLPGLGGRYAPGQSEASSPSVSARSWAYKATHQARPWGGAGPVDNEAFCPCICPVFRAEGSSQPTRHARPWVNVKRPAFCPSICPVLPPGPPGLPASPDSSEGKPGKGTGHLLCSLPGLGARGTPQSQPSSPAMGEGWSGRHRDLRRFYLPGLPTRGGPLSPSDMPGPG